MTTMLAARAREGATSVSLEKAEVPELGSEDVLVMVVAAGLAPGMMALLARGAFGHLPTTVGHEAAGVVDAAGLAEVTEAISQVRGRRVPMRMAVVHP